ncbi:MAG: class I tRNA ligase family protein [Planctomycetota bacterium]
MPDQSPTTYITTPIYYVNDKPHVGHCYTTLIADCLARAARLAKGRDHAADVFFLTGTDEHAEKVVASAAKHDVAPIEWADRNAAEFQAAFRFFGFSNDDFIRTTQPRHTDRVRAHIAAMQASGDVYLGDYEGWYDASQEEYLTETTAREHDFTSPVTGRPLEKRSEHNYFFRLSAYQDRLLAHIEANPGFIQPDARKNEVLGRIKQGLQDVPISRAAREGDTPWGITMPGDESHRVYVWIDALFNYLTVCEEPGQHRECFWPASMHLIAKDILWFHAVIWPCMLMALDKPVPTTVYAHSFWVREGRKMSKSEGNFIDLPTLDAYANWDQFGPFALDALRWYLLTQGPLGTTDADFAHAKLVEVYNADLANGIGNAASRVANMINKYFDGQLPDSPDVAGGPLPGAAETAVAAQDPVRPDTQAGAAIELVNAVDAYIAETRPFSIAKEDPKDPRVAAILYQCAEALRIAAILFSPAMPGAMAELLERFGQPRPDATGAFSQPLTELCAWGGLEPGTTIVKGDALFPRADATVDPPVAVPA